MEASHVTIVAFDTVESIRVGISRRLLPIGSDGTTDPKDAETNAVTTSFNYASNLEY